jgi:2,4-diaminopentanoate dehydrogenase
MHANPLSASLPDEQSTREYRVVQWATGTIGARALRAVIEHPRMSLAGVYVHGQETRWAATPANCAAPHPPA